MSTPDTTKAQDESLHLVLTEILAGIKYKFVQPVLNENIKLFKTLEELKVQDQAGMDELKERVNRLEQKVDEIPLLVLTALRDAINQASEGV